MGMWSLPVLFMYMVKSIQCAFILDIYDSFTLALITNIFKSGPNCQNWVLEWGLRVVLSNILIYHCYFYQNFLTEIVAVRKTITTHFNSKIK